MDDIRKVNSVQLYYLWRNFAIALLSMAATIAATHMLPFYMAPVVSLFICGVLYTMILNNSSDDQPGCMVVMQSMLYSLLGYTFVAIVLVISYIWSIESMPDELVFFNDPYMPALILLPVSFVVTSLSVVFKKSMPACSHCRARHGNMHDKGYYGYISSRETDLQLKNMAVLFALLSVIVWWYYINAYVNVNQNGRDWYVFVWVVILMVIVDEVYFMMRYYNLYLDLEEHNEIITPEQLRDMTAKTYLRFYVICGEYMYIDRDALDRLNQIKGVYDTPFITKRTVNGITTSDVRKIVVGMTGQEDGELRFFYGRHLPGVDKHSLLRYFYFLDGDISEYKDMGMPGEWIHFNEIKRIYNDSPLTISASALNDLSRLSTIILTERVFDEDGMRKNRIRSYKPHLTLADVRNTELDLQDDKWIRVANFNSDTRFFRIKRFLRQLSGGRKDGTATSHKKC